MSFHLHAAGYVPDTIEAVKAAAGHGDTSQMDAAKAYILSELEQWPTDEKAPRGVIVEASGHHDASTRSVSVKITPLFLLPR